MKPHLLLLALFLLLGCSACHSFRRDPGLPLWSPVSPEESLVLRQVRQNPTPTQLLKLSLIYSGLRTKAAMSSAMARYQRFVSAVTRRLQSVSNSKQRAALLLRELHLRLLKTGGRGHKNQYSFNQTRIDVALLDGRFNCVSSAVLYGILASHFGFQAKGVLLKGHVFVQIHGKNGGVWEVETTSPEGFDKTHDAAYYREQAKNLSRGAPRGYKPPGLREYKQRVIVSLFSLVNQLSLVQHTHHPRMSVQTRLTLREIAGMLDKDLTLQANRVYGWDRQLREALRQRHWRRVSSILSVSLPATKEILTSALKRGHRGTHLAQNLSSLACTYHQIHCLRRNWSLAVDAWKLYANVFPHLSKANRRKSLPILESMGYQLWKRMLNAGEVAQATRSLSTLCALFPKWERRLSAVFWFARGNHAFEARKFREAKRAYQRCIRASHPNPHPGCVQNAKAATLHLRVQLRNEKVSLVRQLQVSLANRRWQQSLTLLAKASVSLRGSSELHRRLQRTLQLALQRALRWLGEREDRATAMKLISASSGLFQTGQKALLGAFFNALGRVLVRKHKVGSAHVAFQRCIRQADRVYGKACRNNLYRTRSKK